MDEKWKDICGYEGLYKVSDYGRVKRLPRELRGRNNGIRHTKQKMLSGSDNGNGYKSVQLFINGYGKRYYIHRLVAEAFLPNPNNLPEINHINEDKSDNRLVNLEWVTHKDNINYGHCLEKIAAPQSFEVNQFDRDGKYIKTYKSINEAHKTTGIDYKSITNCTKGKQITAGGYIWRTTKSPDVISPKNHSIRPVDQYDLRGDYIKTYPKISEAAKANNISLSAICGCCKHNFYAAGGYVWRYHGEEY